jgi:hypothetical protein
VVTCPTWVPTLHFNLSIALNNEIQTSSMELFPGHSINFEGFTFLSIPAGR